jgi:predicted aldo/keto reductase-like oxidoreductase
MTGEGENARVDRELAIPMIHRAFEAGVNYMDTAVMYCNHDSQRAVGEALKGWRDRIVLSTKNHYYGEDEGEWWKHLENSLERLQVETIDIYNHHGINWKSYQENVVPRVGKWMQKAKDQGLIRHICCSFHDDNAGLMNLVESGYPDVITLQYNLLDQSLAEGIASAHEHDIGVVCMGPVGGGRLGADSDVLAAMVPDIGRVPELALRFVLSNPHITVALSGMSTMQHVEENVRVAADSVTLSAEEREAVEAHMQRLQKMSELYCTGCGYCMPCEAGGVDIPHVFRIFNMGRVYGLWEPARAQYAHLMKQGKAADACVECGECEPKCPQKIQIREELKKAHEALS